MLKPFLFACHSMYICLLVLGFFEFEFQFCKWFFYEGYCDWSCTFFGLSSVADKRYCYKKVKRVCATSSHHRVAWFKRKTMQVNHFIWRSVIKSLSAPKWLDNQKTTETRQATLAEYFRSLLNLPPKISRCQLVHDFLKMRPEDETPPAPHP